MFGGLIGSGLFAAKVRIREYRLLKIKPRMLND